MLIFIQNVVVDTESVSSASSSEQPVTSQLLDGANFLNMPSTKGEMEMEVSLT